MKRFETNRLIRRFLPEEFMTWEMGYVFNPTFYGKGYAIEAIKEILRYAFEELNAHSVIAEVNINNHK